ncbi:MAG: DNA polymerase III subunit delta' [Candidatus Pacebacteria bacterium]|nr:DNA polymerase III subunit delta' [Candidatus Paceibacterota bacterium]
MHLIGHKKQIKFLRNAISGNRMPQALLFLGEENLGKKKVAFEFVKMLFCSGPTNVQKPCGVCQACLLVEEAKHPDFIFIAPQARDIQISQIRNLQKALSLRPVMGKVKAIVIDDAHCLNIQAQNCFLKTLEEPQGQAVFILISSMPDVLLPTIKSRCEAVKFYPLTKENIEKANFPNKILDYSQGRPGIAFSLETGKTNFLKFQESMQIAKNFLVKDLLFRMLFIKDFFPKDSNGKREESLALLESMLWLLRSALWQRASGEIKPSALLKTKNAIELTQEAKIMLQTTNVSPRLLLENLVLQF